MTKLIKSGLTIILFSIFGLSSTISYANKILNCSSCSSDKKDSDVNTKQSNIFGLDLGKIKPKDPYFHLKRIVLKCNKKNDKSYKKTLMSFISSEFFYSTKTTKQGATLVIGYVNDIKTTLKIKGIESYFPNNAKYTYEFETNFNNNIFDTLKGTISGSKSSNEECFITSSMKWGGDIVPYTGKSFTVKEKKIGLKRAINSLKMFESKQFDLSQTLAQNNFILGFKFELSDLMTDLTMNLAKLEIEEKDKESKKLAQQRTLELEEERTRLKAMEIEKKRLEEKTKQLAEQNRLAELNAKTRSEEVAAQEREKLEKERALRKVEEKARKIAQEKTKQLGVERQKADKIAKQLELERVIAEQKNKERLKKLDEKRKKSEKIAEQLRKERKIAEQKAKDLEQTQLASLQNEKKKRELIEKKLISLQEENKKSSSNSNSVFRIKLPPEWVPFENKMSLQQEQFCQLTNRFFEDIKRATKSGNEIKINIVHKERQENLDGLLPGGKVNNWIFKVVKIDQVEDGSAAVVLSLQCKSFVGSGQIHTRSTWRKKSSKEWRATIPYDDRRFRELAKLDKGQFILGSGVMLEINAFKPGQKETFYASQQIGDHPLAEGLNLEGELFITDLSYIAALN
ncbi:hypothetical protein N8011_00460 [Pseudomonadota bacterium]|nr:hypothetical protein [Pseudomonadota bacterium]